MLSESGEWDTWECEVKWGEGDKSARWERQRPSKIHFKINEHGSTLWSFQDKAGPFMEKPDNEGLQVWTLIIN